MAKSSYPYVVVHATEENDYLVMDARDGTYEPYHFRHQRDAVLQAFALYRREIGTASKPEQRRS